MYLKYFRQQTWIEAAVAHHQYATHSEGFLPPKSGSRRNKLIALNGQKATLIFYESPHRLLKTLKDMQEVWNDPTIVVARELTKKFEEVRKDKASLLIEHFTIHPPKGEFVLLR